MSKSGKLLLSGGLVLASGAYAWWQHVGLPENAIPASVAVREPAQAPRRAPLLPLANPPPPIVEAAPTPVPIPRRKAPRTETALAAPAITRAPVQVQPEMPPPEPLQAIQLAPPPPVSTGRYADGEFVGNSIDTEWGPVQVKVVVRNGDIADAICIVFPIHRRRSAQISEWAIPMLYEEAIKAQSAQIDLVSQASFTSEGYQKSLASALARARKP
jgi:uncharacterized protein with FMN-binding domain